MRSPSNNAPIRLIDDPATAPSLKQDLQVTANWTPIAFPVGAALSRFEASIAAQEGTAAAEGTTEVLRGLQDAATTPVAATTTPVAAATPVAASAATSSIVKIASLTFAGIGLAGGITYGGVAWQQSEHQAAILTSSSQEVEFDAERSTMEAEQPLEQKAALSPPNPVSEPDSGLDQLDARQQTPTPKSKRSTSHSRFSKKKPIKKASLNLKSDSLSKEADMIGQARKYLAQSPDKTLRITSAISKKFPKGVLVQEREGLEILALYKLGRNHRANNLAKGFLRKYPQGTMAERIRRQSQQ